MKMSAHTKIGLENEDTRKLRNEVTFFYRNYGTWWVIEKNKTVDPKFPGTGLSDIKKSFEKIAMTFLARTKIKGNHQSSLCCNNSYGT
jgi:hypothetical protein